MNDLEIKKVENELMFQQYAKIRYEVFTVEKNVPEEIEVDEYDTLDSQCDHFLIIYKNQNMGAIRIKKEKLRIRIQRFCLLKELRQLGIGRQVISYIENYYKKRCIYQIVLDSKYDVFPFYEKCGYQCISKPFVEANILHVQMQKDLLEVKQYDDLPQEAIALRKAIFMDEQGFQDEFDERDHQCTHLVVFDNHQAIGTCRYFYENGHYVLGRIAVSQKYRSQKIGSYIVMKACQYIEKGQVVLHAQLQAKKFYQKLGFQVYGDIEYEEHCPHIWMEKTL